MMLGGGSPERREVARDFWEPESRCRGLTVDTERGPRILGAGSARLGPEQLWPSAASTQCPDPPRREQPGSWRKADSCLRYKVPDGLGTSVQEARMCQKDGAVCGTAASSTLRPPAASGRRTRVHTGAGKGLCGMVTVHIPGTGQTGITAQRMASHVLSP